MRWVVATALGLVGCGKPPVSRVVLAPEVVSAPEPDVVMIAEPARTRLDPDRPMVLGDFGEGVWNEPANVKVFPCRERDSPPDPAVTFLASEVIGVGLAREWLEDSIVARARKLQRCFDLPPTRTQGTQVRVDFTLGTAGAPTDVQVTGASAQQKDCVQRVYTTLPRMRHVAEPERYWQTYDLPPSESARREPGKRGPRRP